MALSFMTSERPFSRLSSLVAHLAMAQPDAAASISTHVLNTATGQPGRGMRLTLHRHGAGGAVELLGEHETNEDGRVKGLPPLPAGTYRVVFETEEYFRKSGGECFYPRVTVDFTVKDGQHYHVPLLISPYGFSTYRGS